ncbi:LysR substrate-binding domain-containing protein [Microbacterium sp.]|uniref:LysR substrate-binding domain-containing protein n=1 Tax=Microbacterium sp. TaxID=51671 RepID=UPI003A8A23CB
MDIRQLHTFRLVVERGSFSAAADELDISQPAVSLQVRSLEESLGHRLLDRGGRPLALTEAGEAAYRCALRVRTLEQDLVRELQELDQHISGPLMLGSSTGPGELVLPRLLGEFAAAHPQVEVRLQVLDTQTVCDRVLDETLELGMVGAARPQRGLTFTPFMRDELVVIVAPDHDLAGRERIGLAELADHPLIMQQEGSGVRAVIEQALRVAGIRGTDLTVTMELGLQQSVKAAVLDGFGVTVISRLAVEREITDGSLVALDIEGDGLARQFWVVQHAHRTPRRAVDAFTQFAAQRMLVSGDAAA